MTTSLSKTWKLAQENLRAVQKHQKSQYNKKTGDVNLKVGDRVMVLMAKGE